MAGPLKLEVVMSMVDKALAPLRGIDRQAKATAEGLRASRKELRGLEQQQDQISGFRKQQAAVRDLANRLAVLRSNLASTGATYGATSPQAAKLAAEVAKQNKEYDTQHKKLLQLRGALNASGVTNLSAAEATMGQRIARTTDAINRQTAALKAQGEQQRKMAALKDAHGRAMAGTAAMAGAGVAGVVTGATVARPVRASLGAYGEQENASTQLRASMMQADGSVPEDFERITELATRLGDRLPGTTAEFQEMMTMLRRQGLSAQSILGGTGEAAALLGVQLRMPVTEAAEFAAKMQDATSTTEGDMQGLMDMIQRTFYLGVDSGNMLQGFSNLSPVMGIIKKEGLEASNILAPMLVMMDQVGMAGESAGNAIRKVFQAGFDEKKLGKANDILKSVKAGFKLDFSDGKGEFGGVEQLFAQLKQLERLDTTKRTTVLKQLFGDDAETLRVLNTFMKKGIGGYNEVVAKMQAQADLRKRVDMQLGTLSNVVEAAQGTWTNVLAAIGETVAPDAKNLVNWLGETASAVGAWVKANPQLVAWLAKIAAVVAVLYVAIGGLMLGLAGILGPMLMVRFALRAIGVQGGLLSLVLRTLGGGLRGLAVAAAAGGKGAVGGLARLGLMLRALPAMAMAAGRSVAGGFGTARSAIVGATARLWAYVVAQKAAAVAGARRGIASAGLALAVRGPGGLAKDAAAGIGTLASTATRGGVAALGAGLSRVFAIVKLIGRAALLNPVGLALTALAGAALLVIKYWEPIKAFFAGLWSGFSAGLAPLAPALAGVFGAVGAMVAPLRPVWDFLLGALGAAWAWCSKLFAPIDATAQSLQGATAAGQGFGAWLASIVVAMANLTARFFTFGANIVQGLIGGIQSMLGAVREAVGALGRVLLGKFTGDMQIHSPSRVFRAAGVNIGEGAALGMEDTRAMVRKAAAGMAAAAAVALPAPTLARPPEVPELVQRVTAATSPQLPELVQQVTLAMPPAMATVQTQAPEAAAPELAAVQTLAPIDRRPPLMAAPPRSAPPPTVVSNDRFEFHIHAAPGMDVQMLAAQVRAQVRAELDRRDADKRSRAERSFLDMNHS